MSPARTSRRRVPADDGFTLIEVLVAMVLLVTGLLATLSMLDEGNRSTARTLTRDAAVGLARDVVERAATLEYSRLAPATVAEQLRLAVDPAGARGSAATGSDGAWTLRGRTTFRVQATSCSVAAPGAGVPVVDAAFCGAAAPAGPTGAEASAGSCRGRLESDPTVGAQVRLLVAVDLCVGDTLARTVCALLGPAGTTNALLAPLLAKDGVVNVLLRAAGGSATVDVCGQRPVAVLPEPGPADGMRRVRIRVTWGDPVEPYEVVQTVLVPRPAGSTA